MQITDWINSIIIQAAQIRDILEDNPEKGKELLAAIRNIDSELDDILECLKGEAKDNNN